MTLHFFGLNLSYHLSCHACSCMRSCCSSWQSCTDFTDLYITQSSANSRTVDVVCSARSLMKIRKNSGPSTDPCGTPDFTDAGLDVSPSTTTVVVVNPLLPAYWGESASVVLWGFAASFSRQSSSRAATPEGSLHKSRADSVVGICGQLKRCCVVCS